MSCNINDARRLACIVAALLAIDGVVVHSQLQIAAVTRRHSSLCCVNRQLGTINRQVAINLLSDEMYDEA